MRNFCLLSAFILFCLGIGGPAQGQTPTYSYAGGSSCNSFPWSTASSNRVQGLYMPNQFIPAITAGNITDVYWKVCSGATSATTYTSVVISIGTTTLTTLSAGPWNTGLTTVYTSASVIVGPVTSGWVKFTLQTPFFWNGTSNLIIDAQNQTMSGVGFTVSNGSPGYNGRMWGAYNSATASTDGSLAGLGFDMAPAGPCTSPPTPGIATSTAAFACVGGSFTLGLTGNSGGLGQTYQWQSCPTVTGPWTNIGPLNSAPSYTTTGTSTLYYRAAVTCGTGVAYSTPVLVNVPGLFPGGTYTINSALPTAGINFQTFTDAVAAVACGISGPVIFNVAAGSGPYNEQITIPFINTTPVNTITFNCNNTTLTYTNNNAANYATLRLNDADYIRIKRLNIVANPAGTYGYGLLLTNNADNNIIDSCSIDANINASSSNYVGLAIGGSSTSATTALIACDSNIVSNTNVAGGYYNTVLYSLTSPLQQYNQLINNTFRDFYIYGLYMSYNNNTQLIGNDFHRNNRTTLTTCYFLYHTSGNTKTNCSRNRIHNPFGAATTNANSAYGIYNIATAGSGTENVFSNNIMYNFEGSGTLYGINNSGSYAKYYYNSISLDYAAATGGIAYGFYQSSSYSPVEFKNNIVSVTRGGTGAKYAMYHSAAGYVVTLNNNDYYVSGTGSNIGFNGSDQPTLASWKAATGFDAASISAPPAYASLATGNLTPTNVAADNAGLPISGYTLDILNTARSATTPDVGAYEFNNFPCTSPPTAGTATANPVSVCPNGGFQLSLTGQSSGLTQTYQWQSATSAAGPWTNTGPVLNNPNYSVTASTNLYYRAAVTCGTQTAYSAPVQISVAALFPGGTYTINATQPASSTNFQSFTAAVNAMACGIASSVIFNVAPGSGPYTEQVVIPPLNTNSSRTVTFNGNNNILTYTNTTNAANYAVLQLNGADWFRFNKLTVTPGSTGSYGYGIVITNDADNNIIDSCLVDNGLTQTSSLFAGIVIGGTPTCATCTPPSASSNCDSNTVSNSEVIGGYYATAACGYSSPIQQYNQFLNNRIHDYYVYGMYLLYNNNHQIIGNEFHRVNRAAVSTFYGIVNTSGNLNGRISRNSMHDPFTAATPTTNTNTCYFLYNGASATPGNENIWSNNILYNLNGAGTHYCMYSIANSSKWYYNTISADYTLATAGTTYGYYQSSSYTGIDFRNNIISLTRGGGGAKYAVYLAATGYATTMNRNDYYVSGTGNNVGFVGAVQATLANWQTASGQDANSLGLDPTFVSAATGDMTPANLAIDNMGTPVAGITTDYYGISRNPATPDAGAVEFNNPCNLPSNLLASGLTVSSANLSWTLPTISGGAQYAVTTSATPPASGTLTTATSVVATGLNANTTYYLHVRNRCTNTTYSVWVSIPFTTCIQSVITPLSALIFCSGNNVTLTATPGSSYVWSMNGSPIPGATGPSYTTATPGSYTVTVTTNTNGCVVTSAPAQVLVSTPPATITPSGSVNACPGVGVTLSALSGVGYTYQWMLNGANIPGATSSNYTATTAGSYTVFISSGPNCNATSVTPANVSMLPPTPAAITPPAYTAICPGSTITLNANTGTGLSYAWQLNGSNIPGGNAASVIGTSPGVYTVMVTNVTTGCTGTSAPLSISAASAPAASINSPAIMTACDTAVLTANGGPGFTYQWVRNGVNIAGATSQSLYAYTSGGYSVIVTNNGGCSTSSNIIAVTVNPGPTGIITYNSPLVFCQGQAVVLNTTPEPGMIYQWMLNGLPIPGASTPIYIADQTGLFSLFLTNNYGCTKSASAVQVTVHPLPNPVIAYGNSVLSTGNFVFYQWFFNGQAIAGANYSTYAPPQQGSYSVMVTDAHGCSSTSLTFFVSDLGIHQASTSGAFKVYPNPAASFVTVENTGRTPMTGVSLINAVGAVVYESAISGNKTTIQTSALPAGIYTIRIQTAEGIVIRKLELVK